MKIKPIARTIKATALANPNPSFVSQVKAGANQRPFRAIKMDAAVPVSPNAEAPMKIKQKASATVKAIAPKGYGVAQFEFSKEKFADEAAVKKWMDEGGYEGYEIVETSKGFEISNTETTFETGTVIKMDTGVDGLATFVGRVIREVEEEAAVAEAIDDAAAAAAEEITTKSDDAPAEGTEASQTAAGEVNPRARVRVAGDAPATTEEPAAAAEPAPVEKAEGEEAPAADPAPEADAAQPVASEKAEGEEEAAAEEPSDADRAKAMIEEIGAVQTQKGTYDASQLGSIISQLGWIVYDADYSGLSEGTVAKIKGGALSLLDAYRDAANEAADQLTEVFRTSEERAAVEAVRSAEPAQTEPTVQSLVDEAVARAMEPLQGSITEANDRATAAEATAAEAVARAEKAEQELAERVEADSNIGQTRKGAEDLPTVESTDKSAKDRPEAGNTILRSFGSRHAR